MNSKQYRYPISYDGSIIWPILFIFLFPPITILLLILNCRITQEGTTYALHYRGSTFWLIFWTILFFPVAILLGILRGFDLESNSTIQ